MTLIERYIAKAVLASILLVTFTLVGLHAFILFIDQLSDLGKGNYHAVQAALVVLLGLPYQIYLFFPVASLLGALIGLGMLANHRELIVMRAAGMSIFEMTRAVFKAAVLLILIVTFMGEIFVPYFSKWSHDVKMQALSNGKFMRTSAGVWVRTHNDFLRLGTVISNDTLQDIVQFHFNKHHQLTFARAIETAHLEQGQWIAEGVRETQFADNQVKVTHEKSIRWNIRLNPLFLVTQQHEADEMNLVKLHQYLSLSHQHQQSLARFKLAYWQRLIQPFTTLVMILLSIPFILGPLRSSTMGAKLLIGVSVGFGFHLINRFFGPVTQVLQWPPEIAAIAPTLLFALLGILLIKRTSI